MRLPTKPVSRAEYSLLLVLGSVLCFLLGLVGFGFWFFAKPEDAAEAELLQHYSLMAMAAGFLIWLGRWVIKRLVG